jgi:Domain of unknown function (DUF4845)
MKHRQRGATFLGIVIILLILGAGLYAGIRLVPVYLEYTKVARALEQVRDENAANDTNPQMIRRALERHWEIAITKTADGYDVQAAYDVERPFVANVYLLTKFDKLVTIQQ